MILGIGTDLVHIPRMEKLLQRFGVRAMRKLLTSYEQEQCFDAASLAKRFAAKEALLKAMGTGMRAGLSWQMMEVRHTSLGAPRLVLSPRLQQRLKHQFHTENIQVHLSLADEANMYALAFVVLSLDNTANDRQNLSS